jgi:hypothetical protein
MDPDRRKVFIGVRTGIYAREADRGPASDARRDAVANSVMVWLVDPGEQAHQPEAMQRTTTGRSQAPGAASGVNEPPAFTRMLYGVYESLDEAKKALSEISNKLRENEPLEITSGAEHANRIFLIPAYRVHYVVCNEVERPRDRH